MKNVDIIVPIYNAFEYTEECIKSILENTNLKENTLVLINDKSPDERIMPMLTKYKQKNADKNIVIIENEENSGFVKTVNIGMQYSKNDVILLNSDTEVTKDWIEKIKICAYSNPYIATVTPLTNNGTIASVPNFGVDNELPNNISVKEYAQIIEKCSYKKYPELTTGNGFCMYIKRKVIEEIGLFDDITFEKGYGEENDFCYRALDYGYTNVLCDNTFIYHKGTQSFKKENLTKSRAEVIESHMRKLRKKYPVYTTKTDQFLALNPIRDIQENIRINTLVYKKKRILFLVNEWEEDMEMTGGTSLHLKDIINGIRNKGIASFVLCPDKNDLTIFKLYVYIENYGKEIAHFKTDINLYGQINYTNNSYIEMIETILDSFKIDLLHIHHLLFNTFDCIDIAKKRGIYSIITLHDLYMSCPSINMVYENKFCEGNEKKDCKKCLKSRYQVENNILQNWRKTSYETLKKFDKIIVPSENTKKHFKEIYNDLKIEVIEHGTEKVNVEFKEKQEKNTFDIAFVGAMAPHKGSNILKDLIKQNKNDNIKIHLFGKPNEKELEKAHKNYINHGKYKRGELPQLLVNNQIDLVCMFATWPETYSYTLTETYMANVPVISFKIGAVGDRIQNDNLGWTIPLNTSTNEIIKKIEEISNNKKEYEKIKNNFQKYKFKLTEEMQNEYIKIYENNFNKNYENTLVETNKVFKLQKQNVQKEYENYVNTYSHIVNKYNKIRATKMWKIAKKIKRKIKGN